MKALIAEAASKNILFTVHALDEMNSEDVIITVAEVVDAVVHGDIIEDYPEDRRGQSCLMFHEKDRPLHVVCAPKANYLAIITAYRPDPQKWEKDLKTRKTQ
ncbi:MAG: DUF4258 domain-containing protein [Flavobacteriales bacterium]|nr:DUF4258 domain-containing protein [Flavobacteriales bacterium]